MANDRKKEVELASSSDLTARGNLDRLGYPGQALLPHHTDVSTLFETGIWRTDAGLGIVGLPTGETGAKGLFKSWGDVNLIGGIYRNIHEYINLETGMHYEKTRHESTGTWTGWGRVDSINKRLDTYTSLRQIGLTQDPNTITMGDIFNALKNKSDGSGRLSISSGNSSNTGLNLPTPYGQLICEQLRPDTMSVEFISTSGNVFKGTYNINNHTGFFLGDISRPYSNQHNLTANGTLEIPIGTNMINYVSLGGGYRFTIKAIQSGKYAGQMVCFNLRNTGGTFTVLHNQSGLTYGYSPIFTLDGSPMVSTKNYSGFMVCWNGTEWRIVGIAL